MVLVMVLLVPAFLLAHSIEEVKLYDGCVILWRPDVFQLSPELNVPAFLPELVCNNIPLLWVHVDWCIGGEQGGIVTATPNEGTVNYSTF